MKTYRSRGLLGIKVQAIELIGMFEVYYGNEVRDEETGNFDEPGTLVAAEDFRRAYIV